MLGCFNWMGSENFFPSYHWGHQRHHGQHHPWRGGSYPPPPVNNGWDYPSPLREGHGRHDCDHFSRSGNIDPNAQSAGLWGDPHLTKNGQAIGDTQGHGQYELFENRNMNVAGTFSGKDGGPTVATSIDANLRGGDNVHINIGSGETTLNGENIEQGRTYELSGGNTIRRDGNKVLLHSHDYDVTTEGGDQKVTVNRNPDAQDRGGAPEGMLGQQFQRGGTEDVKAGLSDTNRFKLSDRQDPV